MIAGVTSRVPPAEAGERPSGEGLGAGRALLPSRFGVQAAVLILLGLALYANSILNRYALDDGIVIVHNEYVREGWKGIPKILTSDAYDSYARQMGAGQQLSGGRYRPLSIVTFAVERGVWGDRASLSHAVNVALYVLSLIVLLWFLRGTLFERAPDVAFLTAILFAIHPIHTEVVANLKSRDEILSLLFLVLACGLAVRYYERRQPWTLLAGLACFSLALLSKEYAVLLVMFVPVLVFLRRGRGPWRSFASVVPFLPVLAAYAVLRVAFVGAQRIENPDVLNNPFLHASPSQALATKIVILLRYLKLLVFPFPLSCDYSYQQIPYASLTDPLVWVSVLVHAGLAGAGIWLLRRRHPVAFAILAYVAPLAIVSNLLVEIGATMGERLVYHASLGFVMAGAWSLRAGVARLIVSPSLARAVLVLLAGGLVAASAAVTIPRNAVWRDDFTLFSHDVEVVPKSVLANGNAGTRYLEQCDAPENKGREKELARKALGFLSKALAMHPRYVNGYLSQGIAHFKLGDYDRARQSWDEAARLYPGHPYVKEYRTLLGRELMKQALASARSGDLEQAVASLTGACEVDPGNAEVWYHLGGACYTVQDVSCAARAWRRALEIDPAREDAKKGLAALAGRIP